MATITAAKAGNWSDTSVWNGGVVPGNGDTADLNNYAITMDITTIPASGSLLGITDSSVGGAGYITVALDTLGNSAINVNYSGATGIVPKKNTTGVIQVTGTTSNTLTVTSNLKNGAGANNSRSIYWNSTGKLVLIGNITGTAGNSCTGIIALKAAGSFEMTGNISSLTGATSVRGVYGEAACSIKVTGDLTGGTSSDNHCIYATSTTGPIEIVDGTITGGSGSMAHGVFGNSSLNGALTLTRCILINGTGGMAIAYKTPTWTNDGSKYWQITITEGTVKFGRQPEAGKLYTGIVCGDVTGTLTLPADEDVQDGVSYGAGGTEFEGDFVAPAVGDVQSGVQYGAGGTELTGTFTAPAVAKVLSDTSYGGGGTEYTGTYHEATTAEVKSGTAFGPASGYTGTYDPTADDVWPAEANVWYGTGAYGPTGADYTPSKRASSIANCTAGNVKKDVVIDNVTGTYDPMAAAVFPDSADVWHDTGAYGPTGSDYTPEMVGSDIANCSAGNIKDSVTIDDVTGTYDPTADDVWPAEEDVFYGTGAYGPTGADYTPSKRASSIANCSAGNIKSGVVIDDVTGTYAGGAGGTYPSEDDVRNGEEYGPGGTDYTGNLTLPAVTDVQSGVTYGTSGTEYTGTFTSPSTAHVKKGIKWGANGTEFTGTYELVVSGTSDGGTVFSGIRALLLADADVTVYGIYAGQAPENAKLPYIVLNYVDAIHEHHMASAAGKVNTRLQLDLYGTSWDQVYALAEECRLCLDSYRGSVAVGDDSIRFNQIYLSADNTSLMQEENAAGLGYFRASQDYSIWTAETVPTH
jgi:hypothetical protein